MRRSRVQVIDGGRYHIADDKASELGYGSYSKVYQGVKKANDGQETPVAIKILTGFSDTIEAKTAYREMFLLRHLKQHPSIVELQDVVFYSPTHPDQLSLYQHLKQINPSKEIFTDIKLSLILGIMNTDLKKYLEMNSLSDVQTKTLLFQMLCGVRFLHAMNVFHRDLKPANILVNINADTGDCSARITDFGMARLIKQSTEATTLNKPTTTGLIRQGLPSLEEPAYSVNPVTACYRAPEVILLEPYTEAIDIWSIGCIFAEMLGSQNRTVFPVNQSLFPGKESGGLNYHDTPEAIAQHYKWLESHIKKRNSQMWYILQRLGRPSEEELSTFFSERTVALLRSVPDSQDKGLDSLLPHCMGTPAMELLKSMLAFNPTQGISIEDAIHHEYFDELRHQDDFADLMHKYYISTDNCLPISGIDDSNEYLVNNVIEEALRYRTEY